MLTFFHIFLVAFGLGRSAVQNGPGCLPNDRTMDAFMMNVRFNIRRSPDDNWHGLDFERADTLTVRPVRSDSLCQLALETLRSYLPKDMVPYRIRLLYAGKYFVAEYAPIGPVHSEFWPMYFFDSTLKKVLFPCSNGYAC